MIDPKAQKSLTLKNTAPKLESGGFEKNGDQQLTERFNPFNQTLNKKRFEK